jgi:hypothetical protein
LKKNVELFGTGRINETILTNAANDKGLSDVENLKMTVWTSTITADLDILSR